MLVAIRLRIADLSRRDYICISSVNSVLEYKIGQKIKLNSDSLCEQNTVARIAMTAHCVLVAKS